MLHNKLSVLSNMMTNHPEQLLLVFISIVSNTLSPPTFKYSVFAAPNFKPCSLNIS